MKGGYEVRIARQRAFCPFSQIDTCAHRARGARRPRLSSSASSSSRRTAGISSSRGARCSRRSSARRRRSPAVDRGRRGDDRPRRLRPRLRRVRRSRRRRAGPAPRLRDGLVARRRRVAGVKPGDEITVKVLRVDDDKQKISLGLKQLTDDPVVEGPVHLRGRPGAHRPRHPHRGVRGVRRARARHRRAGARVDVLPTADRADWSGQVARG